MTARNHPRPSRSISFAERLGAMRRADRRSSTTIAKRPPVGMRRFCPSSVPCKQRITRIDADKVRLDLIGLTFTASPPQTGKVEDKPRASKRKTSAKRDGGSLKRTRALLADPLPGSVPAYLHDENDR